jgi:hypothetical protein
MVGRRELREAVRADAVAVVLYCGEPQPHGLHLGDLNPRVAAFDALAPRAPDEQFVGGGLVEVAVLSHGGTLDDPTTARPTGEGLT